MNDWIAILEAAYRLDEDLPAWLQQIAETSAPILDRGQGAAAIAFQNEGKGLSLRHIAMAGGAPDMVEVTGQVILESPASTIEAIFRSGIPAGTISEVTRITSDSAEVERAQRITGGRSIDGIGCVAHAGGGAGLGIMAPLAELGTMPRGERARWRRIALHVGAAYRLRLALEGLSLEDPSVEAILEPNGRIRDARGCAQSKSARHVLREAAERTEKARGPLRRRDGDESLALWRGLVRGRWSLVDHFDSDGRRFVVARRNEPGAKDPRGLADRELQTAELLGFGYAPKEIAYALGLAPSTVCNALTRARVKLGLRSQIELAAFFSPGGLRQRLVELELAGESLAVGVLPLLESESLSRLTDSERAVALCLVQGATYREVCLLRKTSERTVANQVQSIYRKLGIGSRAELGGLLLESA
jgi:DNA-binding NarL/FixJ family response regulator